MLFVGRLNYSEKPMYNNLKFKKLFGQNVLTNHPSQKNHFRLKSQYRFLFLECGVFSNILQYIICDTQRETKNSLNTGSVIRPQYCTVNTSIAVQHIRLCVQVNLVKQGNMRLEYSAVSHSHHEERFPFFKQILRA